jgi:hypothetical protein
MGPGRGHHGQGHGFFIHTIDAAQLAECARWCRSNSTHSPARARTDWQGPDETPSATTTPPPLLTNITPRLCCSSKARMVSPRRAGRTAGQARSLNGVHENAS